jgi:hypothetical protein
MNSVAVDETKLSAKCRLKVLEKKVAEYQPDGCGFVSDGADQRGWLSPPLF